MKFNIQNYSKIIKKQNKKTNNKNNLELLTDDNNFILSLPEKVIIRSIW